MNPALLITAIAVAVAIFLVVITVVILRLRRQTVEAPTGGRDRWLSDYLTHLDDQGVPLDPVERPSVRDRLRLIERRSRRLQGYGRELADADIQFYASEWFSLMALAGVAFAVVGFLILGSPVALAVGPVIAYFGGGAYVRMRQNNRQRKFDRQLGDALMLVASALKAGFSFDQAMQSVAEEALPPVRQEFARYTHEVNLGLASDKALLSVLRRNHSFDLNIAISAIQIHRQVGGNLAEVLEKIAETIRERVRIRQEIRTLTSQARFSGYLVALLPFALALFLNSVSKDYFQPMLDEPAGIALLIVCGFMIASGALIIRKIVNIKI